MFKSLICAVMIFRTLLPALSDPSFQATLAFKTGSLLRLHVVAQDDSEAMQALKLVVRDEVRECYAAQPREASDTMLVHTEKILPLLIQAAEDAAAEEGFDQPVTVLLGWFDFDRHEGSGFILPAGRYPALIVQLGDAQGHNWWGLLDPESALFAASTGDDESAILWDWSWQGFLDALRHFSWLTGSAKK